MAASKQTIQRKLTWVIMITTTVALLVAGATIIFYELASYQKNSLIEIRTLADVMAANSSTSLLYDDDKSARETLSSFAADNAILGAALYTTNGTLFARYPTNLAAQAFPKPPREPGYSIRRSTLVLFEPVQSKGKRYGTLYLKADLGPIYGRIWLYAGIVVLVLAGSFFIALVLSKILQAGISRPITSLVHTAQAISERKDYSVRATKATDDELGVLTDSFNHMLGQIQERDAALSEKEERLRLALEGSRTGTWEWNLRTGQVIWDAYHYALHGLKPGEFGGTFKQYLALIHPLDRDRVSKSILESVEKRKDFVLEYRIFWPDGSIRYMSSRGNPYGSEQGGGVRLTGVTLDITETKLVEEKIRSLNADLELRVQNRTAELTAANLELEAFTYSVAHDLRAPLRHVDGFAQMLQEEMASTISPEAAQMVLRIRAAILNMGRLVDALLNLSRVGRRELKREAVPLGNLVKEVIAEHQQEHSGRDVEWRVDSLPAVECDPGLVKQVISNLLSNALKYTRPRSKAVIEIGTTSIDGETAVFVRDNGVGFDMKYASKLFGVFQRLHRPEEFEGTGVGLATVDRIVRKHGGRIWAEAEPEKGATFYFTLESRPGSR
jgi:PAS domain S-box-containing protein